MSETGEMQRYVESEVESLESFDFVAIGPAGRAFHMVEVSRGEDHGLEVRVPGRPPFIKALSQSERASLRESLSTMSIPSRVTYRQAGVPSETELHGCIRSSATIVAGSSSRTNGSTVTSNPASRSRSG